MALQNICSELESEALQEFNDQKTQTRTQITKWLIEKGEELDQLYTDKKNQLIERLNKREQMLKAEKYFKQYIKDLQSEDQFIHNLLDILQQELLLFVQKNRAEYEKILCSWIQKVLDSEDFKQLTLKVNPQDFVCVSEFVQQKKIDALLKTDNNIQAGFLLFANQRIKIDLTFQTLFKDRKQNILQLSMQLLKESL